jgi:flagella basal body P-ring formation protein FlgA
MTWSLIFLHFLAASVAEGNTGDRVEVSKDEIRQSVIQFLQRNHPWRDAEVRIQKVRVPGSVLLSFQGYDLSIRAPSNTRYLGHTPLEVVFQGETSQKRIWVSAYLEVLHPVVVIKKPMVRHQIIMQDDVCLEKRDLAKVPPGAITEVNEAVGLRLKRTVGVGTVLRGTMMDKPPLVNRGDVVKLLIETESLRITTLGRVDERGGLGDTVRVINLDSKRRVYGRVVDGRTVRVRH